MVSDRIEFAHWLLARLERRGWLSCLSGEPFEYEVWRHGRMLDGVYLLQVGDGGMTLCDNEELRAAIATILLEAGTGHG